MPSLVPFYQTARRTQTDTRVPLRSSAKIRSPAPLEGRTGISPQGPAPEPFKVRQSIPKLDRLRAHEQLSVSIQQRVPARQEVRGTPVDSIRANRVVHDETSCGNVARPTSVGERLEASSRASRTHVTECHNIRLDTEHSPHLVAQ